MTTEAIEKVREFEKMVEHIPSIDIETTHDFHAGMYARTVLVPANSIITGVLIKCATLVIIQGDVTVFIGGESRYLTGYNIISASPNRKQVFRTYTDTYITMVFPSNATSIDEAEHEFTDEVDKLITNKDRAKCQE